MIFCVEDDEAIRNMMVYTLRSSGFSVKGFGAGDALFAALEKETPQLILLDIMLPGMDGLEILQRLRLRSVTANIPIIMATARGTEYDKVRGLDLGADDYLAKPFSVAELLARVQALMRRASRQAESTVLKVEDLEMDLVSHKVTRRGERISLQPLEYQLLEYLMRNRGRVVSRNTILERVWDYDFDPHTNVVEARVCRLREKIDRNSPRKLISTVRGVGYVLG